MPTSHEVFRSALYPFYLNFRHTRRRTQKRCYMMSTSGSANTALRWVILKGYSFLVVLIRLEEKNIFSKIICGSWYSMLFQENELNMSSWTQACTISRPMTMPYGVCLTLCLLGKILIQSNLDFSNSDISNFAKFVASIWIKNTFWLLSRTKLLRWGLFYKFKLPEVQINLHFV